MKWRCRRRGHEWVRSTCISTYYVCSRCGEPGFWVPQPVKEEA